MTLYDGDVRQAAPLILIDVDGVLNPRVVDARAYRRYWAFPAGMAHRLWLNPQHGRMLAEVAEVTAAELVWATYWQNRANRWVGPRVGLPSLRFVPIPSRWRSHPFISPGEWKARQVAAWIGQTPFVWLEDDPDVPHWLAEQPRLGKHLVITVDPLIGLTRTDLDRAGAWLSSHHPRAQTCGPQRLDRCDLGRRLTSPAFAPFLTTT